MKRAIILILAMLPMVAFSQTVTSNYKTFAGAASDTLTASATKTYTLNLTQAGAWAGKTYDATLVLFNDYDSDSLTYAVKVYRSNDGVNIAQSAADSLSYTKVVEDIYSKFTISAYNARYLIIKAIGTSQTQKGKLYGRIYVTKH